MKEGFQVLDARSRERFTGEAPEPRPGIRGGHIPGSFNLPFTELVRADGTLRPEEELRAQLTGVGVDLTRPVITLCGSGVTACALLVALQLVGHEKHLVYDGSWTEWGGRTDTTVAVGS
jgi:thiosulfate/3-mercaptopyruvate sulfurtransferase